VLIVSLEDSRDEVRRRIKAARLRHGIGKDEVAGWLHYTTPAGVTMADLVEGSPAIGKLEGMIRDAIKRLGIDVVSCDPFVKAHTLPENDNMAIDFVCRLLTRIAHEMNVATDTCHHTKKGATEAGNADNGRGATSLKDAGRLVYTITKMTGDEAGLFGIGERERLLYVRYDSAKVNICPPSGDAEWFKLVGMPLGNGDEVYKEGDTVQTVEPWTPPDAWAGLSYAKLNEILTAIDAGLEGGSRYSDHGSAKGRAAWKVVQAHAPDKTEKQCRAIIAGWVASGTLESREYEDAKRREMIHGLYVVASKRPG
jgi:hypothetical protein